MKKILIFLGIGAVVGTVAYAVWQCIKKENPTVVVDTEKKCENASKDVSIMTSTQDVFVDEVDFARKTVDESITKRHEEAAQIIRESIEVICEQKASPDKELEKLNQIANELDDLLEED